MAKVPDLFEDLKNCYSENEEYSSEIDHLTLNQKSFYDASYDPLHEDCTDKFMSPSTSETSKTPQLTLKKSVVMVAANGKILKKRRLSLNQFLTADDLEAIANEVEEEIMKPRSVAPNFYSSEKYNYQKIIKSQFILNDNLSQSVIRKAGGKYLAAAALQNLDDAVKFDMGAYTSKEDSKLPVTLRISKTRLFVSAQNEDEPVLLKEMPETPKTIRDETNLLFFWERHGSKNYFKSVAHPKLFIATQEEQLVHMARGLPSVTDFQILETQS
ncbi:interleukin-1 alpha precursor [Felis catus]|uniref:Interleukin-1 alpha n=1 Tax=Felis catus TaxID=9685 RepID=IL1A_FELCA|nr:interleukin-1 alpha precursor [Felis catus]O46613.1 RecName: Full=Interleukin-1 alpha; Short=IL-1 alpha; Flags: Precursor [Felis catus]AAC03067.1 prointerleukin-1 alpha [Felis catus]